MSNETPQKSETYCLLQLKNSPKRCCFFIILFFPSYQNLTKPEKLLLHSKSLVIVAVVPPSLLPCGEWARNKNSSLQKKNTASAESCYATLRCLLVLHTLVPHYSITLALAPWHCRTGQLQPRFRKKARGGCGNDHRLDQNADVWSNVAVVRENPRAQG